MQQGSRNTGSRSLIAFRKAIETILQPSAALSKAFAHVVRGVAEGAHQPGGVEHRC